MPEVAQPFLADTATVSTVRRFEVCTEWQPDVLRGAASLIVSVQPTQAIIHLPAGCTVTVAAGNSGARVAGRDNTHRAAA